MKQVAIVGGGITGLAAAYFLNRRSPGQVGVKLIESAPTLGGKITSARERGFVVEGGPDSFLTQKRAAIDLCRELGLADELMGTNDAARRVYVWSRGRLRLMPDGVMLIVPTKIMPFVRSSLISWPGKLRMGLDAVIPARREDGDESLAHFVRRRLGAEALDIIAEPMIAGIYVADAESLSLKSTFPRFLEMERKYGSLLRGMLAQKRAATRSNGSHNGKGADSMFMTLRPGLQQLTDNLAARLEPESVLTGQRVLRIRQDEGAYQLTFGDGGKLRIDEVILATPAYEATDLLREFDPVLAMKLGRIRYVSTATVSLGFDRSEVGHALNGFGFVVPRREKRRLVACSWSSTKFSHRAPEGCVLLRAFVGGAHAEHLAEQPDEDLVELVRSELETMMGIRARPVITRVYRWHKANPQYEVGHQARVSEIEELAAQHPGLHLAGAAYHGVGIPDCIEDAKRVAEKISRTS